MERTPLYAATRAFDYAPTEADASRVLDAIAATVVFDDASAWNYADALLAGDDAPTDPAPDGSAYAEASRENVRAFVGLFDSTGATGLLASVDLGIRAGLDAEAAFERFAASRR